jgi:Restriction endonuclease BglII
LEQGSQFVFQALLDKGFQVEFHSHAQAIMSVDFPDAITEIEASLIDFTIPIEEIIGSGGGQTKGTQRLAKSLSGRGWIKTNFIIEKTINGVTRESISHEIDHVKNFAGGKVALEIEWNNKDPFFDRDLENMKRLHADAAISAGVIITRGESLQARMKEFVLQFANDAQLDSNDDVLKIGLDPTKRQRDAVSKVVNRAKDPIPYREAWTNQFVSDKYGAATTHWRKLEDRVHRGVGNPCPLLLIGLPAGIVTFGTGVNIEILEDNKNEM